MNTPRAVRLAAVPSLPDSARCVVIGGGVGGTSIAYHLARAGWGDVVLVEQHELGDGTTWHSAGFVGQLRSTISQTRMIMYSTELYARLGELSGRDPGWRGVGGLRVATTPERQAELERGTVQAVLADEVGADAGEVAFVGAAEAVEVVEELAEAGQAQRQDAPDLDVLANAARQ